MTKWLGTKPSGRDDWRQDLLLCFIAAVVLIACSLR